MLRRTILRYADYKGTSKVSEAFHNVINRNTIAFDHVAIDVGSVTAQAGRMLKDLIGAERDAECVKFVNKTIFNTLLRRIKPTKSLALMFDGTDPLWRLRRNRAFPSRQFESRFYRSAASPMVYTLEDRLLQGVAELTKTAGPKTPGFDEFIVSGPATVGPAESKLSQWMLDLASKPGSKNDSICLVGGTDLLMSALGAVPFHNVTTMSISSGDFKSLSVKETFDWLCMDSMFSTATTASDAAVAQRLGQVRTDIVLLLLLSNGISATDLQGAGVGFKDLMDSYADLTAAGEKRNEVFFLTTDDGPHSSVRIHCAALEKLVSRATRKTGVARACKTSADYLEVLLQTHAMICTGGILNHRFVPRGETILTPKPPLLSLENFVGHLKHLAQQTADNGTVHASVDATFALTPAEMLLVSSPNTALIEQILPMYSGGHVLPNNVADSIVDTKDINEALERAQSVLAGVGEGTAAPHRGASHSPSHHYTRVAGSSGPPANFEYKSVNLGLKARICDIRRVALEVNAKEETVVDVGAGGAKNVLVTFNSASQAWETMPCSAVEPPAGGEERVAPSTLRCVTWNVQFNKHSGETTPLGRAGIDWCSSTRYIALAKVLEETDADVIGMQEVEEPWWTYLSQQQWVKDNYTFTCQGDSPLINPWGVLVMVHRRVAVLGTAMDNVAGFSGHTSIMPSISVQLSPTTSVAVKSFHLLAPYSSNNISNRVTQVQNLIKQLGAKNSSPHCVVMGDFNDFPSQFLRLPAELRFKDAWEQVHPEAQDPLVPSGYTIDGTKNPYAALIIEPQFYGRADRILAASSRLQPIEAELIGTTSVQELAASGKIALPPNTKCPEYLHPSDHFGVVVEFQIV